MSKSIQIRSAHFKLLVRISRMDPAVERLPYVRSRVDRDARLDGIREDIQLPKRTQTVDRGLCRPERPHLCWRSGAGYCPASPGRMPRRGAPTRARAGRRPERSRGQASARISAEPSPHGESKLTDSSSMGKQAAAQQSWMTVFTGSAALQHLAGKLVDRKLR